MEKKVAIIYSGLIIVALLLIIRIYWIINDDNLSQVAQTQSSYKLDVAQTRGNIYDQNFELMVNDNEKYLAAISPSTQAFDEVLEKLNGDVKRVAIENLHQNKPFLLEVDKPNLYAKGIHVFKTVERYNNIAHHIIGYTDADGKGMSGIEMAYQEELKGAGSEISIKYTADPQKTPIPSYSPEIEGNRELPTKGVVLTLDKEIQKITEQAMDKIEVGSAVVMDVETGEILAGVSKPIFNPNKISDSLEQEEAPLLNRCFQSYAVGSTFKLVVALTALEQGIETDYGAFCDGYIDVDGRVIGCHYKNGHQWCDMEKAIKWSCNPYFVELGLDMDMDGVIAMASAMGFGKSTELADGIVSEAGYLPTSKDIAGSGDIANFSFGQGTLMATPVQVAQMIASIANGGYSITPSLVKGITNDGNQLFIENPIYQRNQIASENNINLIKEFMKSVVDAGSGENAKPEELGAGGKTASAQTGQYKDGEEVVHAWFGGFYPAENPKYSIVVLEEGGVMGGESAAPVFKEICDNIYNAFLLKSDETR